MKLRNKKTGVIGHLLTTKDLEKCEIINDNYELFKSYNSLTELNEEWEDYTPKEPLIKDEKIRKAVRAWAEASEVNSQEIKASIGTRCTEFIGWRKDEVHGIGIGFRNPSGIENIEDGEPYTIAELCGEEEECES